MEIYLVWLIVGLLLSISEVFVGAFVLLVFGIAAMLTGVVVGVFGVETLKIQLFIYVLMSVITGIVTFLLTRNIKGPTIGQAEQYYGEVGMVVSAQDINLSPSPTGQVRFQKPILGSDLWECHPHTGTVLKVGERVRLIRFQGKSLLVEAVV